MAYLVGLLGILFWLGSLPWHWPPGSIELLLVWLVAGVLYMLADRHWPALTPATQRTRDCWFRLICLAGLLVGWYNLTR